MLDRTGSMDSAGNARTSGGRAARIRATPSAWLTRAIAGMGGYRCLRSRHPAGGGRWGGFVGHGGRAWCERQRFRKVSFTTCLGKVVVRCREGLGGDAPATARPKPDQNELPGGGVLCYSSMFNEDITNRRIGLYRQRDHGTAV
jgi:hypothetical protein